MIYALIALVSVVSLILLLMRTNTAVVFLAVCAGSVLLNAAGKDTDILTHSFGSGSSTPNNIVQAGLVLLPGIVSAILLIKRIPKRKLFLAVVPAVCATIVGLTLVYPFLTSSFQSTLTKSKGWSLIAQYYELIVALGIVSSLFTIAFTIFKPHKNEGNKKKKH
jgi:hypothetical protein